MDNQKVTPLQAFLLRFAAARMLVLFAFHAIVFAGCYGLAYLLRFDFAIPAEYIERLRTTAPIVLGTQLLVGAMFGYYRGWWRYVGVGDVVRLVFGMTTSLAILLGVWYAAPQFEAEPLALQWIRAPRGVLLINWAFSIILLLGTRVVIRLGRDRFRPMRPGETLKRVIIIGAGDAGESLAREIEHRPQLGMKVVAFVDDQRAKWNSMIRGINVTGPIARIQELAEDLQVDEALIAIPSASGKRLREIIHHLSAAELPFKTIPGIDHLVTGRVHVTQLRPVNVEDLLRRAQIDLPGDPVRELFRGKRVMVTGAGGTIGSELAAQIAGFDPESLLLVERSEYALYEVRKRLRLFEGNLRITSNLVDICDYDVVESLLERERPHIVLHAAAHKHVPIGEENPAEYLRNNCLATRRVAELCEAAGVSRFVLISTDKAINPTSIMGASKRAAEIALLDVIRSGRMKATVVRFGNVIGSSGSVIPLFMEQIAAGGPVTVTDPEVTRYFIRTSEAVSLVLQAATLGDAGDIFMLDMGEPVKVADLARDLIRLSNHTEQEIPIVFTGLRPGEKMFEEIRLEGESIRPTVHPQIVVTEAPQPDRQKVSRWVSAALMNTSADPEVTVALVRDLVPEYVPTGRPAPAAMAAHDAELPLPVPTLDGERAWV